MGSPDFSNIPRFGILCINNNNINVGLEGSEVDGKINYLSSNKGDIQFISSAFPNGYFPISAMFFFTRSTINGYGIPTDRYYSDKNNVYS